MKFLLVAVVALSLLSCIKAKETKAIVQEHVVSSSDEKTDVIVGKLPDEGIIHNESHIRIDSVSVTSATGEKWYIGKKLDDSVLEKKNVTIATKMFGVEFGPIDGYSDDTLKIGWNNRNRVVYIEILSPTLRLPSGLALGASKSEVINLLGLPYMEKKHEFRYQNIETEVIGVLFIFSADDRVESIVMFAYV
jgi:hypothetical protein